MNLIWSFAKVRFYFKIT